MKIVPITEPSEGFVVNKRNSKKPCVVDYILTNRAHLSVFKIKDGSSCPNANVNILDIGKIVGALNITHRIEDDKLVEIKRNDIEEGDVFEFKDDPVTKAVIKKFSKVQLTWNYDVFHENNFHGSTDLAKTPFLKGAKKIGLMDVHYKTDWSIK